MERERERRPILEGRLLNSCFWSANWICRREKDDRSEIKTSKTVNTFAWRPANNKGLPKDYKRETYQDGFGPRVPTETCSCVFDYSFSQEVQCSGTGHWKDIWVIMTRCLLSTQSHHHPHPAILSALYHTSLTSWSLINFCPSSINGKNEHRLHFRVGWDWFPCFYLWFEASNENQIDNKHRMSLFLHSPAPTGPLNCRGFLGIGFHNLLLNNWLET